MVKKLYYTKALLRTEVEKCLHCQNKPCKRACPVGCDPQFFIQKVKEHDFVSAAKSIREKNPLGEICGLVCPSKLCMRACLRSKIDYPINIPKIQATILADTPSDDFSVCEMKAEKIAVVGAGPAGIGAAVTLVKNGFSCTLFEKNEKIGGMLNLIPSSRLSLSVIDKEMKNILSMPLLQVQTNVDIKDPVRLLHEGYDYVILATGEGLVRKLNIPGEEYAISWIDFLNQPKAFQKVKKVAVIGGGNVAHDCAKVLKEIGVHSVEMFVRRPLFMMKVEKEKIAELIDNQINLHPNMAPVKIEKNNTGFVVVASRTMMKNDKLIKTKEFCSYDGFDLIIKATGGSADKKVTHHEVFYAGDCKLHASSVVEALADGIQTAHKIIDPLLNKK